MATTQRQAGEAARDAIHHLSALVRRRTQAGDVWRAHLRWSGGLRWLTLTAVLAALATPALLLPMRPSGSEAARLLLCMALSGVTSILLVGLAWRFARISRPESIQARFGTVVLLSVLVVAINVLLLARLLFQSSEDLRLLFTFVAFSIAVALAIASPVIGRIARALSRLEVVAGRIASGDYDARVTEDEAHGTEELAHLANSINQIAQGIQQAYVKRQAAEDQRRHTIIAVSHDLRTPVGTIQAMIEAIADGVVTDPDMVSHYHERMRGEVLYLSAQMEALFELTRLEAGALALHRESTELADMLTDAIAARQGCADETHASLRCQIEHPLPALSVDAGKLYRVVDGLLDNALRYTPAGGTILVRASVQPRGKLTRGETGLLIEVIDTGSGIAESDLPHVFEPSFRGEASRARAALLANAPRQDCQQVGLGLTVAAHIIKAHGGHIWAASPLPPRLRQLVESARRPDDPPLSTPGAAVGFTIPITG